MNSESAVAIAAVVVAVAVPWMAFRFALQQEHARWLREQRALLYTDMLVEAQAEQEWLQYELADPAVQQRAEFHDLRLPRLERARLGARGTALGSPKINRLFNELMGVMARLHLSAITNQTGRETAQMMLRVNAGRASDELQEAVRDELEANRSTRKVWRHKSS
ncbi:hypothetical protein [Streptomyces sp. NPDC058092]|uniref:hypothetical protein n=1 Tax=Streptomyces sp. NPDC058092 TaxID=3346336 RepID=UPI0036F0F46F